MACVDWMHAKSLWAIVKPIGIWTSASVLRVIETGLHLWMVILIVPLPPSNQLKLTEHYHQISTLVNLIRILDLLKMKTFAVNLRLGETRIVKMYLHNWLLFVTLHSQHSQLLATVTSILFLSSKCYCVS